MDSLIFGIFMKIEEKNPQKILTILFKINEILTYCFLEKKIITFLEFETCLKNNPVTLDIIEFLFLCASPVSNNFIKILKKFLSEDSFNLYKNYDKIENEKNEPFLITVLNLDEEERTFFEQHTSELHYWEESQENKLMKYRLNPQKHVLNTRNLQAYLHLQVSGCLGFFHANP